MGQCSWWTFAVHKVSVILGVARALHGELGLAVTRIPVRAEEGSAAVQVGVGY